MLQQHVARQVLVVFADFQIGGAKNCLLSEMRWKVYTIVHIFVMSYKWNGSHYEQARRHIIRNIHSVCHLLHDLVLDKDLGILVSILLSLAAAVPETASWLILELSIILLFASLFSRIMAFAVMLKDSEGIQTRGLACFQRNSELLQSVVIETETLVMEEGTIRDRLVSTTPKMPSLKESRYRHLDIF